MPTGRAPHAPVRVALVHDWLTGMRGGERCLEVFCELFPEADLFTLLHVPGSVSPLIERRRVVTSFIQRLPRGPARHPSHPPPFPPAPPPRGHPALRSARLRPDPPRKPRRRQGRARPRGGAARLLLLHAHALCLGPLRRLLRLPRKSRRARPPARAGGPGPAPGAGG